MSDLGVHRRTECCAWMRSKVVRPMGLSGGCQCGAVRYRLARSSVIVYACHCLECQKQSASAFALSVPLRAVDLDIKGPMTPYQRPTDSGSHTNCWFCSVCGSRLYHQSARSSEVVTLKGGTLDDPSGLEPVAHLWVKRKQSWVLLPETVERYDEQPDNLKSWRDALVLRDAC